MSINESRFCSFRYCNRFVKMTEISQGIRLCPVHFNKEKVNADVRKNSLLKSLRSLLDSSENEKTIQARQSALAAEVKEVNETFDALEETLQRWRHRIVSRLQTAHDSISDRSSDAIKAEQYERDLSKASEVGDIKKVMELTGITELWLEEATEARAKFYDKHSLVERSVGDVSTWVQQLSFIIDRHMDGVIREFWLDDGDSKSVCESIAVIDDLDDEPCHLACCSNTAGFGSDQWGRIVKADTSNSGIVPLPQPCIFVSFDWKSVDYLLAMSLDGTARLKYYTELDNNDQSISGLHCDNDRQLLFVAQILTVTVTDLSGEVKHVITEDTLSQETVFISAIDGNATHLYLFNQESKCILVVGKNLSHQLERMISIGSLIKGCVSEILLHEKEVLVVDSSVGKLHEISSLSGEIINSFPKTEENFSAPCHATIDIQGRIFVAETESHTVRVFSNSGDPLQTLGSPGQAGDDESTLRCPDALAAIDAGDKGHFLIVADSGNFRLRVFSLL